ncbi:MAG TPA: hypothetical protein VNM15_02150 [Candidatus Binatia bacterium]|nr:hypothetical protein [Candidatus Binatia bacterium]
MNLVNLKAGLLSFSSALIASLCCLLPLAVVLLGLGSGAFMMVTMQYRNIFLPTGAIGVALGYYLYFREKRRCASFGCAFAGGKINLVLLLFATVIVAGALALDFFPELTSNILQGAM